MSAPPFPEVRSPRVGPVPRHPFPWWLLPVTLGMLGAITLLWRVTGPTPPPVPPVIAAAPPVVQTVLVVATATGTPAPTQTPDVVTATPTTTPPYPFCGPKLAPGTTCLAIPKSPTPPPLPTCKADLTSFGETCTMPGEPGLTDGSETTQ